tara:strand:+ start:1987 stop:2682 length:696 start_codon:yes stop_codon:yes gene_type:complete
MKTVWIFGGSYCSGYYMGGGKRDWIAQLNCKPIVYATTPQSPESQLMMLQYAIKHHELPDFVLYDYPPCTRVHMPNSVGLNHKNMTNFWNWCNTRTGQAPECDVQPDTNPDRWSVRDLNWLSNDTDEVSEYGKQFLLDCKRKLISGELPDTTQHQHTISALCLLQEHDVPHVWFSVHNNEVELFAEFSDNYIDIMSLNGTIPTQEYRSKTFNHLSIQQNIMWADYFNTLID